MFSFSISFRYAETCRIHKLPKALFEKLSPTVINYLSFLEHPIYVVYSYSPNILLNFLAIPAKFISDEQGYSV